MIVFIEGTLEEKQPGRVVVNTGGIGYELLISLNSYDRLPSEGGTCRLLTVQHIREDAHLLFGFTQPEERELFQRLIAINGIGPKLALAVLSGLSVRELKRALMESDIKRLSAIPGIGKKTAERMIVEMRDRFSPIEQLEAAAGPEAAGDRRLADALLALGALGYKPEQARDMLQRIQKKLKPADTVEETVRIALQNKT